jgi:hypothetical protein
MDTETRWVGMRPEEELLLCCARTCVDDDTARRIRSLLRQDIDWPYLSRIAGQHRVVPLLYQSLYMTCPEAVPEAVLAQLRGHYHATVVRNHTLTAELLKLLDLFETHHIPAIPLKGPALAAAVYGNVSLREFSDLDILVQKRDLLAAGDLLVFQGYAPDCQRARAQEAGILQVLQHLQFVRDDGKVVVELHWRLTSWTRVLAFPLDRLWQRTIRIPLEGTMVRSFATEDLLLYLCVHGTGHRWESLGWVCDVAELIRVHHDLDWESTLAQASEMQSEHWLLLGLCLARDLLGTPLPRHVGQRVEANPRVNLLARQVHERLFGRRQSSRLEQHLFEQRVTAHWREQVKLRWRIVLFRFGIRWALEPPDGPLRFLYRLLERVPSRNAWIWPLPLYAALFLASHPLFPLRQAISRYRLGKGE